MRIVFIGPLGVGKVTQRSRLAEHLSIPHLWTGEMLRNRPADTDLGMVVASYMNVGRLAPDQVFQRISAWIEARK